MLASWAQWWSSWIWPAQQQQQNLTFSSSVVDASDSTAATIGPTTRIATTSTTNSTFLPVGHSSTAFTTHIHPSASILSNTTDTILDYLSTTTSTITTSATSYNSTADDDNNSTSSLWSMLFSNYTSWLPSSYNDTSLSPHLNIGRFAENLTTLPGSDTLFDTLVNGLNVTSPFPRSSSPSSDPESFFETADFSEDELLFRLIWSNASTYSPDWGTKLLLNDTNGTGVGGMGNGADLLLVPWDLVASIATAFVLGFIIFATVIGECVLLMIQYSFECVVNRFNNQIQTFRRPRTFVKSASGCISILTPFLVS